MSFDSQPPSFPHSVSDLRNPGLYENTVHRRPSETHSQPTPQPTQAQPSSYQPSESPNPTTESASNPQLIPSSVPLQSEIMEEPLYVNAKQYHRILKRRQARAKLEQEKSRERAGKSFVHLSRHEHAKRRKRGPGGRFAASTTDS